MNLLTTYLNDHLAMAVAARQLARRTRAAADDGPLREELDRLIVDLDSDRRLLREAMKRLDVRADPVKGTAGWVGERLGRLKLNGRVLTRSPLSTVVELEGLLLGVEANAAVFRTLADLARGEPCLGALELPDRASAAGRRRAIVERHRADAAATTLAAERTSPADRPTVVGAAGRGLLAGAAGVVIVSAGERLGNRLSRRSGSSVAATSLARLLPAGARRTGPRGAPDRAMHWGTGIALGALRGAMAGAGLRGLRASVVHGAVRVGTDRALEAMTGTGSRWSPARRRSVPVAGPGHHALYALATGAIADALVRRL